MEEQLILRMYTASIDSAKALSEKLLRLSPGINHNSLYIKTLIHSYRFHNFKDKIRMLNKAQLLAMEEDNKYLLSAVYNFKAISFRDNNMTDSAMIYALRAKDLLEELSPKYDLSGVLLLIADMHYYAGQYDDAEKSYRLILSKRSEDKNSWRDITINNNIGLIRIRQKRYDEAEKIFMHSLEVLKSRGMSYSDSSGLPYIYRKILEVALYQKKYSDAENYFVIAEELSKRFSQETELPGLYAAKGMLCYERGKTDSALYFFKKAEYLDKQSPDFGNQINIFHGLADTYNLLNNKEKSNEYLHLLLEAKNKADSVFRHAMYMNIYAEYNYKNYRREIDQYKNLQTLFIMIISVVSLFLFIIVIFYLKINSANKKLVQKNIEAVEGNTPHDYSEAAISGEDTTTQAEPDDAKLVNIITDLKKLMSADKPFLSKDVSLGKIADLLGTNRTYLSKAINREYNVNFNSYINDMRIKEAIHLITAGELQHLNMEGIAEKCGFSNRVSFTKAFQKFTGISPSFFIKNAKR